MGRRDKGLNKLVGLSVKEALIMLRDIDTNIRKLRKPELVNGGCR